MTPLYCYSATTAWQHVLRTIIDDGHAVAPRGRPTKEVLDNAVAFHMRHPVVDVPARKLYWRYLAAEALWILDGDDRVATIAPYNQHIAAYSDDGARFFGAYGPRVVAQLPYVVDALVRDRESRQAVLATWLPSPPPTKDVPCTLTWTFGIRDGRLHASIAMRSSDAWLGWPYDVFTFTLVAAVVAARYNAARPDAPVGLGYLHWSAVSSHLYEPNLAGARACLTDDAAAGPILPDHLTEDVLRAVLVQARDANARPRFV